MPKIKFEELNLNRKLIDKTCEKGFEELTRIPRELPTEEENEIENVYINFFL